MPRTDGLLKLLDEMLVQRRVVDDVQHGDEAAPNEGSRKTLARIAFEEVQDEYTVSYGVQTRKLWGRGASGVASVTIGVAGGVCALASRAPCQCARLHDAASAARG